MSGAFAPFSIASCSIGRHDPIATKARRPSAESGGRLVVASYDDGRYASHGPMGKASRFIRNSKQSRHPARGQSPYAVRYTIVMIIAKPMRSVGEKLVPSHRTEKIVAEMGSDVPSMFARSGPRSFTPCM